MGLGSIDNHKNKIINIAIIILSLIISYNIYKTQFKGIEQLKLAKEQEAQRNQILNRISQLENKAKLYKNFANKKDVSSTLNRLGIIASESGVKIVSLRPLPEKADPLYIEYPFQASVIADRYNAIGKFIVNLENSADFYIVDSADIKAADSRTGGANAANETNTGNLSLEITISTILFK